MLEVLMIVLIVLMIIMIVTVARVNNNILKLIDEDDIPKTKKKRVHSQMSSVNFDSILSGRTSVYDKYKNKDGLYEPVTPKNGINLKVIRKDE